MNELGTFSLHSTRLHLQFVVIIVLTVAVTRLLEQFSPRLPPWERGVLTLAARFLLVCEVLGFALLLAFSVVEQLVSYRHVFG